MRSPLALVQAEQFGAVRRAGLGLQLGRRG
jgi:hypothetical protein